MDSVSLSLVAFSAAATVLTITPGLDTALILRTAFVGNVRGAAFPGLGIAVGCFCWASLVALGLRALLAASHLAYTVLRWIGAAYLVWTGYLMLRYPRPIFAVKGESDQGMRGAFATGALRLPGHQHARGRFEAPIDVLRPRRSYRAAHLQSA